VDGRIGNWRSYRTYTYYTSRKEADPDVATNIRTDGTFKDYTSFWNFANNQINPQYDTTRWVWNSEKTLFNRKGMEIENRDPLGRYNSGIYGYDAKHDKDELTAKQVSHMLWYLLDGRSRGRREAQIDERDSFNEYHMAFAEVETIFLQSKKTGRWWMQLPDKKFIACSYKDYLLASSNEIPERWLRAQERG